MMHPDEGSGEADAKLKRRRQYVICEFMKNFRATHTILTQFEEFYFLRFLTKSRKPQVDLQTIFGRSGQKSPEGSMHTYPGYGL